MKKRILYFIKFVLNLSVKDLALLPLKRGCRGHFQNRKTARCFCEDVRDKTNRFVTLKVFSVNITAAAFFFSQESGDLSIKCSYEPFFNNVPTENQECSMNGKPIVPDPVWFRFKRTSSLPVRAI